ncbi:MAG TPA: hypothetical protein ENG87_05375 [Candidatus Pacearchaeota archaeon]|nr:hypothetical protein [Candidatus Pacearchaeota archaeon]
MIKYDYFSISEGKIVLGLNEAKGKGKGKVIVIKGFNENILDELGNKCYLKGKAFNDRREGLSFDEIIKRRKK